MDLLMSINHCPAAQPKYDILLQAFLVESRIHGSIKYNQSARSCNQPHTVTYHNHS